MLIKNQTVNATGMAEIKSFLAANHKKGENFSDAMIAAWANDAEFQLSEGNPASIEIKSWDCIHGFTLEYTISDQGIDCETVEVDD